MGFAEIMPRRPDYLEYDTSGSRESAGIGRYPVRFDTGLQLLELQYDSYVKLYTATANIVYS
jgi:hypothetical protein